MLVYTSTLIHLAAIVISSRSLEFSIDHPHTLEHNRGRILGIAALKQEFEQLTTIVPLRFPLRRLGRNAQRRVSVVCSDVQSGAMFDQ